ARTTGSAGAAMQRARSADLAKHPDAWPALAEPHGGPAAGGLKRLGTRPRRYAAAGWWPARRIAGGTPGGRQGRTRDAWNRRQRTWKVGGMARKEPGHETDV